MYIITVTPRSPIKKIINRDGKNAIKNIKIVLNISK